MASTKYRLPSFLSEQITPEAYLRWLSRKAMAHVHAYPKRTDTFHGAHDGVPRGRGNEGMAHPSHRCRHAELPARAGVTFATIALMTDPMRKNMASGQTLFHTGSCSRAGLAMATR